MITADLIETDQYAGFPKALAPNHVIIAEARVPTSGASRPPQTAGVTISFREVFTQDQSRSSTSMGFKRLVIGAEAVAEYRDPFGLALRRLEEFRTLAPNWDSYDAEPITRAAIASAKRLIREFRQRPPAVLTKRLRPEGVVPLAFGGVQFEWTGPGGRLEVEIDEEGKFAYLVVQGEGGDRTYTPFHNATIGQIARQIVEILG